VTLEPPDALERPGKERAQAWPSVDIVIAAYNEGEVLPLLSDALRGAFSQAKLRAHRIQELRFVMVDDGSTDRTAEIIRQEIDGGFPAELYRLSRHFGHQSAVSAGLDHADADVVAVMDADLQDPPELIYEMLQRWREGYDVAYGQRTRRNESRFKRLGYWLFYRLLARMSEIDIPLDSGDFCLIDRRVLDAMRALPEKLRFVRGLRAWVGFRQVSVPYERPLRLAGKPKYRVKTLYRLATDGIASSSIRPLRVAQVVSFAFGVTSAVLSLWFLANLLTPRPGAIAPVFLLLFAVLIMGNAVLAFCIYIVGAYLGRTYLEAKGRPSYLIMDVVRPQTTGREGGPERRQTE
jgi:polyisoprenyl-phosphate glycosyltransferase